MGIFRQRVSAGEYGRAILYLAKDWIQADALGAVGRCFPDPDGSNGWQSYLESKGYGERQLSPYLRMAYHCALQATALQYGRSIRHDLVTGAMSGFQIQLPEYQSETMFAQLEEAYSGRWSPRCQLPEDVDIWTISFLPSGHQTAHVTNAKLLLDSYLMGNFRDVRYVVGNFVTFCSGLWSCIGVAERARQQVSKQLKM
jgi:hypothetical protein